MAYKKKVWKTGDIMKQEDINNIENGIYEAHQELQNLHNYDDTEIKNIIGSGTLSTLAQDLKGAINEVFQSASNGKTLIAKAITGKGIATSNTDTFQTMATNINNIKVGGGGITPTGTKEITQNGTYDVTNFASVLVNVVSQGGSSSGNSVESGTITPEEKSTDITIPTSKKCSNMMLFQHVLGTGTGYRTVVGLIRLDDFRTNLTSNSTGATLNVIATSESQINAATVTFRDNGIDVHLNSTAVGGGYLVSKPHVWYAW